VLAQAAWPLSVLALPVRPAVRALLEWAPRWLADSPAPLQSQSKRQEVPSR
jgi:hypothetical protein